MPKPSHRLVTSGSLTQLEARLFSSIRDAKRDDPFRPVAVLCGSRFLGHYLARQLARSGMPHAAVQFLTLNDLARQLAGETDGAPYLPGLGGCGSSAISTEAGAPLEVHAMPAGAKELITRGILASLPDGYFTNVQDQPHLPEVLAATFTDIEDSGADLAKPAWPAKLTAQSKRKVAEAARLYARYRKQVADVKLVSEADLLARAAANAGDFGARFGADFLPVYGFYELTNVQCELLLALARHVSVSAYLFVEEGGHFKTAHRLRDRLRDELSPALENENYDREEPATDLIAARSWVFTPRSETREPDGSVTVLSCPNEVSEGREIARECIRLKRDQGIEFTEMAVLARDGAAYLPLLAEVFGSVGVPFYLREGLPLARTAVGKSILALLRLACTDWSRAEVMEWLTLGALATEAPVTLWDRISREAGIVAGAQQWRDKLEAWARSQELQAEAASSQRFFSVAEQARELAKFISKRIEQDASWQKVHSWSELAEVVIDALIELHAPGGARDLVEQALRSLGQLDGVAPAALSEFVRIAEAVLSSTSETVGRMEATGVHLVSLGAVRHARFRVVFVPGMTERSFPLVGRDDPILLDPERAAISPALPLKRSRPDEERLLFLLACEAAREKLILSLSRKEASSGAEKIPSYYVLRLLSTFGISAGYADLAKPSARVRIIPNSRLVSLEARDCIDQREFDLGRIRALLRANEPVRARYMERRLPSFARAVFAEHRTWDTDVFTEFEGVLPPERREALARRFGSNTYSPSALEQYARCPYHYFLKYVLRLEELEDAGAIEAIGAQDKGDLMHAILRDFYLKVKQEGKVPLASADLADYRKTLREICEQHMDEAERQGITGYRATWELNRRFIAQDLNRYLLKEVRDGADWKAEELETPFGSDGQPSLLLDAGGSMVKIRGRIDRLDLNAARDGLRVVDYKSGKRYGKPEADLEKGHALQLPLYLLAGLEMFPQAALENSRAEYSYITRRGGWKTVSLDGAVLAEKREQLKQVIGTILNGCANGVFPRCPDAAGPTDCSKCDFKSIGDPRHKAIWEKKKTDPRLAELGDL